MITLRQLQEALYKEFHANFKLDEVRPGIYQVFLPAFYPDGDMIDVFLKPNTDGHIQVCDMGLTLMRLSYTYDFTTENKKKILRQILNECNADIENGNIFISTAPTAIYAGIMQFTQLVAKISDMKRYQKLVSASQFYESFKDFIFSEFSKYTPQVGICPLLGREEIQVDYVLQKAGKKPIYLYPVRGTEKANLVALSLFSLQKEKVSFTGVVVHEDFEGLSGRAQKFITDAADKQFTDFKQFQESGDMYLQRVMSA